MNELEKKIEIFKLAADLQHALLQRWMKFSFGVTRDMKSELKMFQDNIKSSELEFAKAYVTQKKKRKKK